MKVAAVFVTVWVLAFMPAMASAKDALPTELDRVQQKRAVELSEHLRCLVCQNQTIADSNAELAQDLRRQVREQIAQGRSDSEIVAFMVQRYGDFVLYKPPMKASTVLLWFGPGMLLLLGVGALVHNLRARRKATETDELSAEQHARAAELLDGNAGKGAA